MRFQARAAAPSPRATRADPSPPPPLAVRIVQQAFEIIHLLTDENPLQVRAWC